MTVQRALTLGASLLPRQLFTLSELNNVELIGIRLICYAFTVRRPTKTADLKKGDICTASSQLAKYLVVRGGVIVAPERTLSHFNDFECHV